MTRLLVLLSLLLLATTSEARDLPAETRRMAERAFQEGRLDDLDVRLAGRDRENPVDAWPLWLRDHYWRRGIDPSDPTKLVVGDREIDVGNPPVLPPSLYGGGEDPYPILAALVADRHRRETRGADGLPEDGPLAALAATFDPEKQEAEYYYSGPRMDWLMREVYHPWPETELSQTIERSNRRLVARNKTMALWGLVVFLVAALGIGSRLGRASA